MLNNLVDSKTKSPNKFSIETLAEVPRASYRDYNDPEAIEMIRSIADAYKRGDYVSPIMVCLIDGIPYISDGILRLRGAELAVAESSALEGFALEAIINQDCETYFRSLLSNEQAA